MSNTYKIKWKPDLRENNKPCVSEKLNKETLRCDKKEGRKTKRTRQMAFLHKPLQPKVCVRAAKRNPNDFSGAKCCGLCSRTVNKWGERSVPRPPSVFFLPRSHCIHLTVKQKSQQWKKYISLSLCVFVWWCVWALTALTGAWYFTHGNDALIQPSVSRSLPGCPSQAFERWKKPKGGKKHVVKRMFFMFGVAGQLACQGGVVRSDTHVITYALGEMIRALQLRRLQKTCEH